MTANIPLTIETYPENYDGYEFITLIRYNDENFLNIIDNVINNTIITYVLDLCPANNINEESIINVAYSWFTNNSKKYPISIEFNKRGIAAETSKILRCFPIDYVSRIIGPLPEYKMTGAYKIRKRKKKSIPPGLQVVEKLLPH